MRFLRQAATAVFSLFLVGYLAWFVYQNAGEIWGALRGGGWHIAAIGVCIFVSWVSSSLQALLPIRDMGHRVGFFENLAVTIGALLGNYTPIRLGTLYRMQYFKRVHGLGYLRFSGVLGVRYLFMITIAGVLGVIGSLGLFLQGHARALTVIWFFAGLGIAGAIVFLLPKRNTTLHNTRMARWNQDLFEGARMVRHQPGTAVVFALLLLVNFVAIGLELYLSFELVNVRVPFWTYLLLAPVTSLGTVIALTPGNLGLREALIALFSVTAGIGYESGMIAGTVDRAVLLAMTIVLGGLGLAYTVIRSEYPEISERLGLGTRPGGETP